MRHPRWAAAILLAAFAVSNAAAQQPTPHIIGPAGVYTVQTIGSTKVEYGDGWVKISWVTDPAPNPGPPPGPGPGPPTPVPPVPPPAPVATGKLFVTLVYDSTKETQAQATSRADLATSLEWAGLDTVFTAIEVSQKGIDERNLRGSVVALPCVIVQELKTGADRAPIVKTLASVDGKDAVLTTVKELRGSKK